MQTLQEHAMVHYLDHVQYKVAARCSILACCSLCMGVHSDTGVNHEMAATQGKGKS